MDDPKTIEEFNLGRVFETVAEQVPEREFIIAGAKRFTYSESLDRVRRLASVFASHGLGVHQERDQLDGHQSGQDHIALALYNGSEYLEGMIASYLARCAPFNVNYRYVGEELKYLFEDSGVKAIVYHASLAPVIAQVLATMEHPPTLLLQVPDDSGEALLDGALDYETALADADPAGPGRVGTPDDLYILYTGGTTGMPKGVLWRQHDIFMAAMGGRKIGSWEIVESYDALKNNAINGMALKVLLLPPLMHGAAQWASYMMICEGATLVTVSNPRSLDPVDVWKTVEREKVNTFTIVGDATMRPLLDELDKNSYDTSSLYAIGNGGAALTATVRSMIHERLPNVLISDSVGSSEAGAQMSTNSASDEAVGSFKPGPGTVVVSEEFTAVLEPGHDGNGWLAQEGWVPLGYLGDEAKSKKTFPVIGDKRYSIPGDRARVGADGVIELLGRDSVTINSGGEKIFAEEVEGALVAHPSVIDVIVTGRPSERWGQEVVAVVKIAPGAEQDRQGILDAAAQTIARYKLPKAIVFVDEIRRSPSGKADYRWAKEVAQGDTGS